MTRAKFAIAISAAALALTLDAQTAQQQPPPKPTPAGADPYANNPNAGSVQVPARRAGRPR